MTRAIHQFVATFEPGAIGNEIVEAQRCLRNAGFASEIFTELSKGAYVGRAHVHTAYQDYAASDDTLVYHMAIGSTVADWLLDRSEKLILRHHNITPVEFYAPWPGANTYGMAWGRDQLRKFAERAVLGLAASEYNRRELEHLRYRHTEVAPVLFDYASFSKNVESALVPHTKRDWLFVGWIAPHKCQHDIIRAFALYRRLYDREAKLHIVGRTGLESYEHACRLMTTELKLDDAVILHGRVDDAQLAQLYRSSAVLVCLSEHEGVGLPLLEAMQNELPIVAYFAAAVPETVGDAGIVLCDKRPAVVASAVNRVVNDQSLRKALVQNGQRNIERFSFEHGAKRFVEAVASV